MPARIAATAATASAVLVLALGSGIARADCPGGGSSGGGGTGSGGGGGGDGAGGGGVHWRAQPACEDESDVVGLRRCTSFGAWGTNLSLPQLIFEGGAAVRRFGSLLDHQTGSVAHGAESFAYRVVRAPAARPLDTALVSTLRIGLGLGHGVYGAAELGLGGILRPGQIGTEMQSTGVFGSPDLSQERGLVFDALGVVGVRGRVGPGGLGVELTGGMRSVSYSFHSSYHGCELTTGITETAPIAEARARGELWLGPWLSAGVTVGTSLLERNAWMAGAYLGVHTRAFGGDRR